ncbi:MAG: FAD-binding protein [Vampirovibrionales bacterium]
MGDNWWRLHDGDGQHLFSEAVTGLDGRKFCSYRVGGPIDLALMPTQYESAVEALKAIETPLTVLGGGCNPDSQSRYSGTTLITKRMMAVEVVDLASGRLRFDAGVPLARVATTAQDHGFSGAEFMIGIPGTVGGAIAMNAGAMGQSTDEIVEGPLSMTAPVARCLPWMPRRWRFRTGTAVSTRNGMWCWPGIFVLTG